VHSKELRKCEHDRVRQVSGTIYQELQGRNAWKFCLNNRKGEQVIDEKIIFRRGFREQCVWG